MAKDAAGPSKTWLTQEAFDRLSAELAHLSVSGRDEVVAKIAAAREEGDLKENGGYHAAREEQGKMEARIRQLKSMLENSEVGGAPSADSQVVNLGSLVTIDMDGDEMEFLLGSREIAAGEVSVYSEKSALGSAVLNKNVGDSVSYLAPNGKTFAVKIKKVAPYLG